MYLVKENLLEASKFTNGPLWTDFKRALMERRPPTPLSSDCPSTAAQQFFLRQGFEKAIEEIEKLPRETQSVIAPPIPATLLDPRD